MENTMGHSNSPASKAARNRTSKENRQRVLAAGGKHLSVLLRPAANFALQAERKRTGESESSVVHRLLVGVAP